MALTYNPKTGEWEGSTGGVNLQELNARKPKISQATKEIKAEKTSAEIDRENMANPYYRVYYKTVEFLAEMYEVPNVKVIARNRQGCSHVKSGNKHYIYMGYESIDNKVEYGFAEYDSVVNTWVRNGVKFEYNRQYRSKAKGKEAVFMGAVHEFAHVLQTERGERYYRSVHNAEFNAILAELIQAFSWADVKAELAL